MNISPDLEDDEMVAKDETAVIDIHIKNGCQIIGCNHIEYIITTIWFMNKCCEVER